MKYPARKTYQDKDIAQEYESKRFTSYLGRRGDRYERKTFQELVSDVDHPKMCLDIPCGTGRFSSELLSHGFEVVGADISREMIRQAEVKHGKHSNVMGFVICEIENLPFKDWSFDLVSCVRLMGHLPPSVKEHAIREIARVTKNAAIITFYNQKSVMSLLRRFARFTRRISLSWFPETEREQIHSIEKNGLKVKKILPRFRFFKETFFVLASKQCDGPSNSGGENASERN